MHKEWYGPTGPVVYSEPERMAIKDDVRLISDFFGRENPLVVNIPTPSTCDPEAWAEFNRSTSEKITNGLWHAVMTGEPFVIVMLPPND